MLVASPASRPTLDAARRATDEPDAGGVVLIFRLAHFGIVDDVATALPALSEAIRLASTAPCA